jgi:hypothetical protein
MDIVARFLEDCIEKDSESKENATVLYNAFKAWCAENEEEE